MRSIVFDDLGKFERLQLAEDLWDEFAAQADSNLEPEVLQELNRRAAWHFSNTF